MKKIENLFEKIKSLKNKEKITILTKFKNDFYQHNNKLFSLNDSMSNNIINNDISNILKIDEFYIFTGRLGNLNNYLSRYSGYTTRWFDKDKLFNKDLLNCEFFLSKNFTLKDFNNQLEKIKNIDLKKLSYYESCKIINEKDLEVLFEKINVNNNLNSNYILYEFTHKLETIIGTQNKNNNSSNFTELYLVNNYCKKINKAFGPNDYLFKKTNHPDCCGVTQLYNFAFENSKDYLIKIKELFPKGEDFIENLRIKGFFYSGIMLTCYLSQHQKNSIEFVKYAGFKEVNSFLNGNSGNKVYSFQLIT